MNLIITELCEVEYIEYDDMENGPYYAKRIVKYDSDKEELIEAFRDYENNFDPERIIQAHDEFEGECLDTIRYLGIKECQ